MDIYELYNVETEEVEEERTMTESEANRRNTVLRKQNEPWRWVKQVSKEEVTP